MPDRSISECLQSRPLTAYSIAAGVTLFTFWLRLWLGPLLDGYPFLLPVGAVTLAMYFAGWRAAAVSALVLLGFTKWFVLPPLGTLRPSWPTGWIGFAFYAALVTTIIVAMHRMQRAEVALRSLAASLEARVDERTSALAKEVARHGEAQDQIRQMQKMEAVGQLTGGVAHDFNNLLTVIRGSVDLLRRPDLTEAKRVRYIDAIASTADRAAKLTGQLLAFARRQALTPTLFDAGQSIHEVAEMLGTLTGSRIKLDLEAPQAAFYIVADRGQFDTALVNMGVNARDAMNGEGTLTIATGPVSGIPAIRSHPPVAGDFVAVTITDTGGGIAPDHIGQIFEPFFTTKNVGQGTGLGLSQVFGFAKQSGGDVRVESVEGEGSTFTLYLPRAYPDGVADNSDGELTEAAGDGVSVLIVEDNEQVGAFATEALQQLGYNTVLACDAASALAELERGCDRFHIVFSDVVMPGMSGLELGQEVRRLYPAVPVVLASGYSHVLAQNGQHGFELLHKPYSIEQLSRVLRKAIAFQAAH